MICNLLKNELLLTLLSHIYRIIWAIRKWLYDSGILKTRKLPCPVICVGNLTTGGTGKTPAVIALSRILVENNHHPAILSRGYKRRSKASVLVVSDGRSILATPEESGDEPYLIASTLKNVPVVVGADRYKSGICSAEHAGVNLFILDDGYQHLKLHRDINILLIDASNPCGNGYLLPKGILREPFNGISRADCVIVTRANEGNKNIAETLIRKYNRDVPIFYASYKTADITDPAGNSQGTDIIKGKKVFMFAGIANPGSFRRSIEDTGGMVIGELLYPDHYWYKNDDLNKIIKEASRLSADAIITTAKDAVRLHGLDLYDKTGLEMKFLILHVEMMIDKGFREWIRRSNER
jgi:tetraacyldisaccharide 4'-kinase